MTPDEGPDPRADVIADAVLRLVAREGFEAVSMRRVAGEAACSLGAVQRTFGDKRTLLRAALVRSIELADQRIAERVTASAPDPGAALFLRSAALEVLPVSAETTAAERVWLAFVAHAAVDPDFGRPIVERYGVSRDAIAGFLALCQARGDLPADVDPAVESVTFTALVDGLAAELLAGLVDEDTALRAVDAYIRRLGA